jgi:hypothetical protein
MVLAVLAWSSSMRPYSSCNRFVGEPGHQAGKLPFKKCPNDATACPRLGRWSRPLNCGISLFTFNSCEKMCPRSLWFGSSLRCIGTCDILGSSSGTGYRFIGQLPLGLKGITPLGSRSNNSLPIHRN